MGQHTRHEITWDRIPGPPDYDPAEVVLALDEILGVTSREEANAAGHRVLYAVGNNHRGSFWPAAVCITQVLVDVVATRTGWPQVAPVDVLIDLHSSFGPEPGWETFVDASGSVFDAQLALDRAGAAALPHVQRLAHQARRSEDASSAGPGGWAARLLDELVEVLADKQPRGNGPVPTF